MKWRERKSGCAKGNDSFVDVRVRRLKGGSGGCTRK